jgi:uncharacterized membrane protein YeiH
MRQHHFQPTGRAIPCPMPRAWASLRPADVATGTGTGTGIGIGVGVGVGMPASIAVMMGVLTGVFGGVLRNVLCDECPRPSAATGPRPCAH